MKKTLSKPALKTSKLRSYLASVVAMFCCGSTLAASDAVDVKLGLVGIDDWQVYHTRAGLQDGSTMYQYIAETATADRDDREHRLRLSFVPRFSCSPLLAIVSELPAGADSAAVAALMRDYSRMVVAVDGIPVNFSPLVERKGSTLYTFLDTDVQRRTTFRIQVEIGAVVTAKITQGSDVREPEGFSLGFSLNGSQKAIEESISSCKLHGT